MKTQCPHCNQHYEMEDQYDGKIIECQGCHQEFYVERFVEPPQLKYKTVKRYRVVLVEEIEELERHLNLLANESWHPVTMSTMFLSESAMGLGGFGAGTKREGLAVILEREEQIEYYE